jgi:hypothetical protein
VRQRMRIGNSICSHACPYTGGDLRGHRCGKRIQNRKEMNMLLDCYKWLMDRGCDSAFIHMKLISIAGLMHINIKTITCDMHTPKCDGSGWHGAGPPVMCDGCIACNEIA